MISMTKLLYLTGPILIIALLALLTSERHYRASFYNPYLVINFLVFLVIWIGSTLALKISFAYPLQKGYFWKIVAAWSIASSVSWLINHFVISGFLAKSGGCPKFSIPILVLTWIFGMALVLGWVYGLTLLQVILTSPQLKWLKVVIEAILSVFGFALALIAGINLWIRLRFRKQIVSVDSVLSNATAIVFGAGVYQESGRPSLVLRDRIETAAALVEAGKSGSVILSGDGSPGSIEVEVMARYAVEVGIPEEILLLDKAGYRTYETCSRACTEFGIRDALLVTQNFHLPRALLFCESLGLEAVGVRADRNRYSLLSHLVWALRESLATAYAWLEVTILK